MSQSMPQIGRKSFVLAALVGLGLLSAIPDAWAQASGCNALSAQLAERKAIGERLSAAGKKQIDAKVACTGFNQLVHNGEALLKWTTANKDWCQIPDGFIESIKVDHNKAQAIRSKACTFAARQAEAEKNGGGQNGGGGGLLGGPGLSGSNALPRGAL